MAEFLSDDWLDAYAKVARAARPVDGADGTIRVTVDGSPRGRVVWLETLQAGQVVSIAPVGPKEPADIELGAPYPVALALWRDGLDPNVAFMQGRLKMNGDAGLWLRLLPELHRPEHVEAMAQLAAETDFAT
jgi:hypothetical protein